MYECEFPSASLLYLSCQGFRLKGGSPTKPFRVSPLRCCDKICILPGPLAPSRWFTVSKDWIVTDKNNPHAATAADTLLSQQIYAEWPARQSSFLKLPVVSISGPAPPSLLQRELEVVGEGLTQGLSDAGAQSWSQLKDVGSRLRSHPLDTTAQFLKDHWHEAAMGAAITFVSPRRLANAALVAFSMRGIAISTTHAAVAASNPNADLTRLRESFRSSVANEGSAFLSSLPMTVAGGMFGRATANSVFGKNLGAYDLAADKVSLSQVRENLWGMHDTVRPPAIKLVVTDMDNTLYSFSRYVSAGVRDGVKDLSRKTGIAEEALYKSIGKQMDTYGSFSYPWSIELALSDRLNVGKPGGMSYEQFRTTISDPFWKTIERSLEKNGVAFPQVLPTLEAIRAKQIPVVVLTNASHSIGVKRLDAMGLTRGKLVERMYVMENPPEPVGLAPELVNHGRERINRMAAIENDLKAIEPIPKAWEKPDPRGMHEILQTYNLRPRQVLMVGDSVKNDIGLARATGTRGLLVRYPFTKPEYESVLRKLSNKPKMEKAKMGEDLPANLSNVAETGTFSGVLDHLNPRADYSAILSGIARAFLVRPEASPSVIVPGLDFDKL